MSTAQPRDRPTTLPILAPQPSPIDTRVAYLRHVAGTATALYREWRDGETEMCRLCPRGQCCASDDACLILVDRFIPREQLQLFSTAGLVSQDAWIGLGGLVDALARGPLSGDGAHVADAKVPLDKGQELIRLFLVQGDGGIPHDELDFSALPRAGEVFLNLDDHAQPIKVHHPVVDPEQIHRAPSG